MWCACRYRFDFTAMCLRYLKTYPQYKIDKLFVLHARTGRALVISEVELRLPNTTTTKQISSTTLVEQWQQSSGPRFTPIVFPGSDTSRRETANDLQRMHTAHLKGMSCCCAQVNANFATSKKSTTMSLFHLPSWRSALILIPLH